MRLFGFDIKRAPKPSIDIRSLSKVKLEKDDILILHCNTEINPAAAHRLRSMLQSVFGENREVMILDEGLNLTVVSAKGALIEPPAQ